MKQTNILLPLTDLYGVIDVYWERYSHIQMLSVIDIKDFMSVFVTEQLLGKEIPLAATALSYLTGYGMPVNIAEELITDLVHHWQFTVKSFCPDLAASYVASIELYMGGVIIIITDKPPAVKMAARCKPDINDILRTHLDLAEQNGDYIPERYRHL